MARVYVQDWLNEEAQLKIEGWARRGLTDKEIAKNIHISNKTFQDWLRQFPAIADSIRRGRAPLEVELENALIKRALGYKEMEGETIQEIVDKDGITTKRKKTVQRVYPPDTRALIFLLTNLMREDYQERPKSEIEIESQRLSNEHQALQNELMKKMLQDSDAGLNMVKKLIEDIDAEVVEEVIEEAEEVLEGSE